MRKVSCIQFAVLVAASGFYVAPVLALNWSFSKGIGISSSYSDNISFTTEELAESGFIDQLSPSFTLSGVGNRSNLSLTAGGQYQGVFRSGVKEADFVPRVSGNADTEIVPNLFFARADVSVTEIASNNESVFDDPLLNPDDSTIQVSYSVNPYFNFAPNETDRFLLDYAFGSAWTDENLDTDTRSQRSGINWTHLPTSGSFGWGMDASYQKTESPEQDQSAELVSVSANLGYLLTSDWRLTAGAGNDWVRTSSEEAKTKFDTWSLQLDWQPNERTNLGIGYGESSVGKSPFLSYTLQGRRSTLEARWQRGYSRQLTRPGLTQDQQLLTALGLSDFDAPEDSSTEQLFEQFVFDGQFSIDESVSLRYSLRGRLSEIALNATYLIRESQQDQTETENLLIGASFNRSINRITDWSVEYLYREQHPDTVNEALFENRVTLTLNFTL